MEFIRHDKELLRHLTEDVGDEMGPRAHHFEGPAPLIDIVMIFVLSLTLGGILTASSYEVGLARTSSVGVEKTGECSGYRGIASKPALVCVKSLSRSGVREIWVDRGEVQAENLPLNTSRLQIEIRQTYNIE